MKNNKTKTTNLADYIILLVVISIFIIGSILFNTNQAQVKQIALALGIFYFMWGVWHHYREDTLNFNILVEYLLISLLGILLVTGLILK